MAGESETERLGGLEVDDEVEFGRLLDRDIAGLRAAQNLVNKIGSLRNVLPNLRRLTIIVELLSRAINTTLATHYRVHA